jgi:hypothetical protein
MRKFKNILLLIMLIASALYAQTINDLNPNLKSYNESYDKTISILWPAFNDTSQRVHVPTAREASTPLGVPARMLMNYFLRDPYIFKGPDNIFYLIGTIGGSQVWQKNAGIKMWKLADLIGACLES